MNTFVEAVQNQETQTTNGMRARKSTASALVDFFFNVGASRGKDIIPQFVAAYAADRDLALRIALWARDVRGGAGERQLFRNMLAHLEQTDSQAAARLMTRVPEIGRWDDLFVFKTTQLKTQAYAMIGRALAEGNGLAAKWCPRKGPTAVELRQFLGLTPKQYRKQLVGLTKVVETQMCANDWDSINYSQVPSQAARIYKKAFNRHSVKFAEYVQQLMVTESPVKINAGAVYPYEIIKELVDPYRYTDLSEVEINHAIAQWNALPNWVGDASILPLVDVSGSMTCPTGKNTRVTCLDVAVSLGLYLADKNQGAFKDTFLTFTGSPELVTLRGNIVEKVKQLATSKWAMNTNLHAALNKILEVAVKGKVPQEDMPNMLLILSDMQFDECVEHNDTAMEMIKRKYEAAGYVVPSVVFWNLNSQDNVPVKADKSGAALVSGFSPSIMKYLLSADPTEFTPEGIMLKTIMDPRYAC